MSALKFHLGRVVFTRKALDQLTPQDVVRGLERHEAGDWGEVDEVTKRINAMAVSLNLRVASKYQSAAGVAFWIFTLSDRSVTTVLLPEDY